MIGRVRMWASVRISVDVDDIHHLNADRLRSIFDCSRHMQFVHLETAITRAHLSMYDQNPLSETP